MSETVTVPPLLAYFGKDSIKQKYVNRMKNHIKADELVRGIGFEDCKGCAVGCTLDNYNHKSYETELGLPEWLARLEDTIFEGMSEEKSKQFPLLLLQSITPGANLDKTYHKFCKYVLTEFADDCGEEPVRKAIEMVLSQHEKAIKGEIITIPELGRLYSAAWSAAWSAAYDKMADQLIILLKECKVE